MLPVQGLVIHALAAQRRQHRRTLGAETVRFDPGSLEQGRHDVDELERGVGDRPAGHAAGRPVEDERRRDATLMHPPLVAAERAVGQVRPWHPVAGVGVRRARDDVGRVADPHAVRPGALHGLVLERERRQRPDRQLLGAPAVVREEDHDRVLEAPGPFESVEHPADAAIHRLHLGGIRLHPAGLPFAIRHVVPRRLGRIALAQLRPGVQDALGDQSLQSRLAEAVPAFVEAPARRREVRRPRMERPVRCGVGEVEEERVIGSARSMLIDPCRRMIGDRVRVVEVTDRVDRRGPRRR